MTEHKADPTRMGASTGFDAKIWEDTVKVITDGGIGQEDVIENFMLFLRRVNFGKFLSHVQIFNEVMDVPGHIVECGVFKGMSLLTFVKLIEVLCPADSLKRVIGFDTFEGFVNLAEKDGLPNEKRGKVVGGWNSSDFLPTLQKLVEITQRDSMVPRVKRVELVKGDASVSIPEYVKANPGIRISLLHLDMDLYEPTLAALRHLYPLVSPGGIVLLDEYGMDGFPGESAAFDDFFGANRPQLKKFPFTSTPGGYFRKVG
ncbi:TylF/MycF family methyltransferase [Reyranella aquatilis]|uniref:TylF/MycF family methyltransferase n=1 Tax=Reyranella aquatilis TaxID=2035356 RepID=A0ABS8L1K3_9HYPH|nr:TylF/MycF/NovP-related O-methyltransferase [Reyranella aquatilis]MCC8432209.1 TylF/MycF family methyltransferase [Reyranella aquatilis]